MRGARASEQCSCNVSRRGYARQMDTLEARTERRARVLRRAPTYAETRLWKLLRDRRLEGLKFRRQVRIGRYIADFVSYGSKLIVEADGGVHRLRENADQERDAWLTSQGFTVLRFANEAVISNQSDVLAAIAAAGRRALR